MYYFKKMFSTMNTEKNIYLRYNVSNKHLKYKIFKFPVWFIYNFPLALESPIRHRGRKHTEVCEGGIGDSRKARRTKKIGEESSGRRGKHTVSGEPFISCSNNPAAATLTSDRTCPSSV